MNGFGTRFKLSEYVCPRIRACVCFLRVMYMRPQLVRVKSFNYTWAECDGYRFVACAMYCTGMPERNSMLSFLVVVACEITHEKQWKTWGFWDVFMCVCLSWRQPFECVMRIDFIVIRFKFTAEQCYMAFGIRQVSLDSPASTYTYVYFYCHYPILSFHLIHIRLNRFVCCHYWTPCIFRLKCAAAAGVACLLCGLCCFFSFFSCTLKISFANRYILLACRYIIFNRFKHLDFGFQIHFEFEIFLCVWRKNRKKRDEMKKWKTTPTTTHKHYIGLSVLGTANPIRYNQNVNRINAYNKQKNEAKQIE